MDAQDIKAQPDRRLFIALFAISGFTGLIYESIWSHYLKLFLGHAAYAQSLVLAIFMGGMALGAWVVSRNTARWANLVRVYALAEACIGLAAIVFHDGFGIFLDASFASVIPALESPQLVDTYKWSMATLLIAPQSILLGMTFPLMAGGVVRRFPGETGRDLALLYFANSLGAAIGALASGFWLIEWLGLPGTIRSAGVVNLCLAAAVWRLATVPEPAAFQGHAANQKNTDKGINLFIVGAFITGAASFVYEIAWIRMLSLVLGTTFHAFELMLSAFITGIALGGWWIRKRIDKIENPVRFLGLVQIVMGMLALATLALYNHTFSWIGWLINNLEATDDGYRLFNFGSHAVAFAIMLPATFCAGMTLPLFTHVLMQRGHGEKSIGQIYASNTLGSISGVMFAVHLGMPLFGLKLLMVIGALLDVALGTVLLRYAFSSLARWRAFAAPLLAVFSIAAVTHFVHLDPLRMAAGVYRTGRVAIENSQVLFYRDGKTATISAYSQKQGVITITTNGKPDASIIVDPGMGGTGDEITMVMAAALPMALKPDAKKIANIGFGSGLTTHSFLAHPGVSAVDSVEIEAAMIEGAKSFMARVANAYRDPRSRIHIEDAKTWFAKSQEQFDVIVSEPSNPWVSGVGSLFSEEFYQQVKHYLQDDGLLIQWLQLYEFNDRLVASVLGALDRNFDDYAIFNADNGNVLIVAPKNGVVPRLSDSLFKHPSMRRELARVGILGPQDIELRRIGSKKILSPLFAKLGVPPNSDYHPYLGLHGPRARFKKEVASTLTYLALAPLPLLEMLDSAPEWWQRYTVAQTDLWRSHRVNRASRLKAALTSPAELSGPLATSDAAIIQEVMLSGERCERGDAVVFDSNLHELAISTLPYLSSDALAEMWNVPRWEHCDAQRSQVALYRHIARRDPVAMLREAESQLESVDAKIDPRWRRYIFATALLGAKAQNRPDQARRLYSDYAGDIYPDGNIETYVLALIDF